MQAFQRRSDRDGWAIALILALALHAGGILLLYRLPLAAPASAQVPKPLAVRLVAPPETRETKDPQFYSELPPDRADEAPKKPDFLSNVTSRARDRVPGGADNLPRMNGEGDAPTVKLEPNGSPSFAGSANGKELEQKAAPHTAKSQKQQQTETAEGLMTAKPIEPEVFGQERNDALRGSVGPGGLTSDIYQPEMDRPDGNASLIGDVSLNTIAWNYAPWLQQFEAKVMRYWFAPPAYSIGLLKEGGWGLFQLNIAKSGRVLHLELLGQQGHPSLIRTAQSALSNVSPLEPLPADFPESTLVLRVRMTYPRIPSR
jgi:hypothetical protein